MSTRSRRHFISLILALSLVSIPFGSTPKVGAADWTPTPPPSIYDPTAGPNAVRRTDYISDVCQTAEQLDCVESIAAFLNNSWVEGTSTSTMSGVARLWTIPGVTNLNGTTNVSVTHKINYTGNLFLQTQISAAPSPNTGTGDRDENSLPRDVKFRAVVRTSWVLPTHVSGKSTDTAIVVEKLSTSGASRITLSGIPTTNLVVTAQASLTSPTGKGDYESRSLSMTVSDGRFYPIKKECVEKPSIMTSENGYGHPVPTFSNGNLDLKLQSPHFRSDGVTPHVGLYEALVPIETATCLWGESIRSSSSFVVEVFETDGSKKNATTSVNVTSNAIVIKASGFTYSTPTIRVKYSANSSSAAKPKKPTGVRITTAKGAITVKFTRVRGLDYAAKAIKGKMSKTLRCTLASTTVTCKATRLTKGKWKVTLTPIKNSTRGTAYIKTVSVR